jgi:hypothetical protein
MSRLLIGVGIGLVVAGVAAWFICLRCQNGVVKPDEAKEMEEITITVDSKLKPKIPFAEVVAKPDPDNPGRNLREITFKAVGGKATVIIPVEGKVVPPQSEKVSPPSWMTVVQVDMKGATLVITEQNEKEKTVEYQVLCDDGKEPYWAEGESPPKIIIPKFP